jgi:endonuclease/exonuclease/phosphatase (EEP) superfamily protein YafD
MLDAVRIALLSAGALLILVTALPFVRTGAWWIRVWDFPRAQIAVAILLVLAAGAFVYQPFSLIDNLMLIGLVPSLAYQAWKIFPYTPLASPQVVQSSSGDPRCRIRLLIANVLMDNRRAGDFLALVRANHPDLVLAVETDAWWDGQLSALERDYPFSVRHPLENTYGMHLFSRLELRSPQVRYLVEDDVPSIRTAVRLHSGDRIDFYGVHPRPPRPSDDTEERDAELLIVGKEVAAKPDAAIIAGDLNDVAWSYTTRLFQKISGTLDPRIGRGMFSTFNAKWPPLRWPLDHVFHEEPFALVEMRRLGFFGSDHFPMLAELCYQPELAHRHEAPEADREDEEEAQAMIEEGEAAAAGN